MIVPVTIGTAVSLFSLSLSLSNERVREQENSVCVCERERVRDLDQGNSVCARVCEGAGEGGNLFLKFAHLHKEQTKKC